VRAAQALEKAFAARGDDRLESIDAAAEIVADAPGLLEMS
jgi:hypothetical protein